MRVAVAGGTGWVGQLVVQALHAREHDPVVLARSAGVDLTTGSGLAAALVGAEAVIDVSNVTTMSKGTSVSFFQAATENLLAAGTRAGVRHHVALSIVGVDRVDVGYYQGKRRQEELLRESAVPWSVLRATQFHEFTAQLLARGSGPFVLVPRMRTQPVAAREVAAALVELAVRGPVGMAPELAGPEELQMVDLTRRLLRARASRRTVIPVRLPGAAGKAMASGELLPRGPGPRGTETFTQWLATAGATA